MPIFLAIAFTLLVLFTAPSQGAVIPSSPSLATVENLARAMAAEKGGALTLDDFLVRLGEAYPELRENYILMHDSQSRQDASYRYPRIVAFTKNAKFIIAFNGHPRQSGYYELEMIEFRGDQEGVAAKDYFTFQRLEFAASPLDRMLSGIGAEVPHAVTYHPRGEDLCQSCHTHPSPRPNWESYNIWPGAYGRTDRPAGGSVYRLDYGDEHDNFQSFVKEVAGTGRYRFLRKLSQLFLKDADERVYKSPNSVLTQSLAWLNYRRVAALMYESKDYELYRYAILGALNNCDNLVSFFPGSNLGYEQSIQQSIAETARLFKTSPNAFLLHSESSYIGKLRFLFEGRGIDMESWSMSFRDIPYSFITPLGSARGYIATALVEKDPSLEPYRLYYVSESEQGPYFLLQYPVASRTRDPSYLDGMCQDLQKRSYQALMTSKQ